MKLLCISGALRAESTNTKLVQEAARLFGPADVTMGDLHLPLYDGDIEAAGIPTEVQALADQIAGADAIVMATPEYNGAVPGVVKNALDWISRVEGSPWAGKPVAILSAAAGRAGGQTGQFSLRTAMIPFAANILPPAVMVGASFAAFDDDGRLKDDTAIDKLTTHMAALRAMV